MPPDTDMGLAMIAHGYDHSDRRRRSVPVQLPEARSMPISMVPGALTPPGARPPSSAAIVGLASKINGVSPHMADLLVNRPVQSAPYPPPPPSSSAPSTPLSEQHQQNGDHDSKPAVKHRRAPVACRRCRRLRSKCQHNSARPPCIPCYEAGSQAAAECFFPARGEPDKDREFRRRRVKASEKPPVGEAHRALTGPTQRPVTVINGASTQSPSSTLPEDLWDLLPPLDEVIEGCRLFFTSYFQLGFLPKAMFIERLHKDKESVNPFLLLGLLAISARFVPKLVQRYGGSLQATEIMIERARKLVLEEMYQPSLERIQGFFLLSVAEWGNGDRIPSFMHMGIAVRMAGILRLHQEETYNVPANASADEVVKSEGARRTFWVIISQESLHSGAMTPASFSLSDITALLPCDEGDFAFGNIPRERAALSGTLAAKYDESLSWLPSRSLFATLIQAHTLWGQCARASTRNENEGPLRAPWQPSSRFAELSFALQQWEDNTPQRHRWSIWNLRGYRSEALDLAYLAIVMVIRLSNIVIRRNYLEDIMSAKSSHSNDLVAPPSFWDRMSIDLFTNVLELHDQVDAFFSLRSSDEGFPAMILFCVYTCGSLAYYLANWPGLCPSLAMRGPAILDRSMEVLKGLSGAWPLAMRWQQALTRVVQRPAAPDLGNLHAQGPPSEQYADLPSDHEAQTQPAVQQPPLKPRPSSSANLDLLVNVAVHNDQNGQAPKVMPPTPQHGFLNVNYNIPQQYMSPSAFAADDFETELNAFLQGGEVAAFWNGVG